MTKPFVDNGTFRRVGDCPTPWPCFVIAVREEWLQSDPQAIRTVLETINRTTAEFAEIPSIDRTLAAHFGQDRARRMSTAIIGVIFGRYVLGLPVLTGLSAGETATFLLSMLRQS